MKEIILPTHEEMKGARVCHNCGAMMAPCTVSKQFTINEAQINVSNIKAYKCAECGVVVYSSAEAARIEDALLPYLPRRDVV